MLRGTNFSAITAQTLPFSPVSYISPSAPDKMFWRAPQVDSEDVWTLIMRSDGADKGGQWLAAESIGKYNSRLG